MRPPVSLSFAIALSFPLIAGGAGCTRPAAPVASAATEPAPAATPPPPSSRRSGLLLDGFDPGVSPKVDLFRHANGKWLETTEIPADRSNYGAFTVLSDEAEKNQRAIVVECQQNAQAAPGSDERKIGDLYASFMDEAAVEAAGLEPLRPLLAEVDAVEDVHALGALWGKLERLGVGAPVGYFVTQDAKDSEHYLGYLYQSGLGLPDRDFYLEDSPRFTELRGQYVEHIEKMLSLAGVAAPKQGARRIFGLETAIAKHHWTRVQRRDRTKSYNKKSFSELGALAPKLDWAAYFEGAAIPQPASVNLAQPDFAEALSALLEKAPLSDWKLHAKWHLLMDSAPYLPKALVDENFAFFGNALQGTPENRERWKRGVELVEMALGEAVGKIYVERHFRPSAKQRMVELVHNLELAFEAAIDELQWMGEDTKKEAHAKLKTFVAKIGYPEKFRDYGKLQIERGELLENVHRARAFEHDRRVALLPGPIDRGEWFLTPQTVNAYYSASKNEIVFPAAILQPPFFDEAADDAVNYGAIGGVIGHEISHGFDDQGRKSDGQGNLRDWWAPEDEAQFQARSKRMVEQYSAFTPLEGEHLNGELTLGENIGDLGGLTVAHRAYQLSLGGREPEVIDGYTGEQRFFLGWAQIYRRKYREEELRRRLRIDSHSPSEYRVNGIVSNMPEFYRAFDVQEGDPLFRSDEVRVKIW